VSATAGRRASPIALGYKCAAANPRLGQSTAPRLGIGAGHGGEIDAQRLGESAVGGETLAARQAAAPDVGGERLDDLQVERAFW
jgi:hypothetical protein